VQRAEKRERARGGNRHTYGPNIKAKFDPNILPNGQPSGTYHLCMPESNSMRRHSMLDAVTQQRRQLYQINTHSPNLEFEPTSAGGHVGCHRRHEETAGEMDCLFGDPRVLCRKNMIRLAALAIVFWHSVSGFVPSVRV